ncbi:MAG: hypothetical protein ITG00_07125 [Flavobacterium sp.]|nr:hypothetical protein [Flavobacterium sp.]
MQNRVLHIVSFDNPYPPVYGGVVEVFHKLKALHELGVSIYLHCFADEIPSQFPELQRICTEVYFYQIHRRPTGFLSMLPYSVRSRNSLELLANLDKVKAPILFEGIKSAYLVHKKLLPHHPKFLRMHNIEHHYFKGIASSELNIFKKWAYSSEAIKLQRFEKIISQFDVVFALSEFENDYANRMYGNSEYIPVFHGNGKVLPLEGFGKYAFYHGDLRMSDNLRAVRTLIRIFKDIPDMNLVIASGSGSEVVARYIGKSANIKFEKIKSHDQLRQLLVDAHINLVLSYQKSGTKLKLMAALFNSRHCIINENITDDEKVMALCETVTSDDEIKQKIRKLQRMPFIDFEHRRDVLEDHLSDLKNARQIIDRIWRN